MCGTQEFRVAFIKFLQGARGTHSIYNDDSIVKSRLIVYSIRSEEEITVPAYRFLLEEA
jgi:hypothetical protein